MAKELPPGSMALLRFTTSQEAGNLTILSSSTQYHDKVMKVYYPGLPDFEGHELAKKQMDGFSSVIAFDLKGGFEAGKKLMKSIKLLTLAVSLGTIDTLIQHPASMTHAGVPRDECVEYGITDGLVRISVGLEDVEDIIADLDYALSKIANRSLHTSASV